MNTKQQKALAWKAYEAGCQNGNYSSSGTNFADIHSRRIAAFERWWARKGLDFINLVISSPSPKQSSKRSPP
jgi:hypothetical protein